MWRARQPVQDQYRQRATFVAVRTRGDRRGGASNEAGICETPIVVAVSTPPVAGLIMHNPAAPHHDGTGINGRTLFPPRLQQPATHGGIDPHHQSDGHGMGQQVRGGYSETVADLQQGRRCRRTG